MTRRPQLAPVDAGTARAADLSRPASEGGDATRRLPTDHCDALAAPDAEGATRPSGVRLAAALAAAVAFALASGNAAVAASRLLTPRWAADIDSLAAVVIAAVYGAVIAALLLVLGRTAHHRRHLLALRRTDARALGYGLVVWTGAYVAAAAFYGISGHLGGPGVRDAVELLMSVGADNGRLAGASVPVAGVILLRILVLSPVAEEFLFRGALFTWLRTRVSARYTILLTGVAFGLIHQSPTFLPLAIAVGLASGWIRERTASSVVPVAVHAVQSAVIVLVSLVATSWDTPALLG